MGVVLGFDQNQEIHAQELVAHGGVHVVVAVHAVDHLVQCHLEIDSGRVYGLQQLYDELLELGRRHVGPG
ncbi:hypothetical protein GCM10020295_82320 [Streptomyces cinereospinus]